MNILVFNWRDLKHEWAGGSEVYITQLAKRWVKKGHKVTLFCGQSLKGDLPENEEVDGINVHRKGGKYTLYFWAFWMYLTKFRRECDVVVDVQNGIPFFTVLYSFKPKVCVVHHVHGEQFFIELGFPYSLVGYVIERFLFPIFYKRTTVVAVSQGTKDALVNLGFSKSRISIVHNGVDVNKAQRNNNHKFVRPTILYLGRIKKYKRVHKLIKLMPEIVSKVPNARLLIAGWGTEGAKVTDTSMMSAIRKKIKIVGPVSEFEKKSLFSKSWVFVNPSMHEGWGLTVIEANSYGVPAVAYKVPGLSESISHSKSGYLAKRDKELVDYIVKLLTDEKTRKRLSEGALKWAQNFSWDKSASKFISVLDSLRK